MCHCVNIQEWQVDFFILSQSHEQLCDLAKDLVILRSGTVALTKSLPNILKIHVIPIDCI